MRSEQTILLKDLIKRKEFLKIEFKKIIFKSILQNKNTSPLTRIDVSRKLTYFKRKSNISVQNNVCLITGRIGGVHKNYNLSRHSIKRIAKLTMLHNTKASSF